MSDSEGVILDVSLAAISKNSNYLQKSSRPKRKHTGGDDTDSKDGSQAPKRAKKSRKRINGKVDDDGRDLDTENMLDNAIAFMDSRLLADHLAQKTKRFRPDLDHVGINDCAIPGS